MEQVSPISLSTIKATASQPVSGAQNFTQKSIRIKHVGKQDTTWCFIDMQNTHLAAVKCGWKIDWRLLREYLRNTHNVTRAFAFLGYVKDHKNLYTYLRNAGYLLVFREVKRLANGKIVGGNVDADLTSYCMDYKTHYQKAIIIADDADYCRTIDSLRRQGKLKAIISPHSIQSTSKAIKRLIEPRLLISLDALRTEISQCANH